MIVVSGTRSFKWKYSVVCDFGNTCMRYISMPLGPKNRILCDSWQPHSNWWCIAKWLWAGEDWIVNGGPVSWIKVTSFLYLTGKCLHTHLMGLTRSYIFTILIYQNIFYNKWLHLDIWRKKINCIFWDVYFILIYNASIIYKPNDRSNLWLLSS